MGLFELNLCRIDRDLGFDLRHNSRQHYLILRAVAITLLHVVGGCRYHLLSDIVYRVSGRRDIVSTLSIVYDLNILQRAWLSTSLS